MGFLKSFLPACVTNLKWTTGLVTVESFRPWSVHLDSQSGHRSLDSAPVQCRGSHFNLRSPVSFIFLLKYVISADTSSGVCWSGLTCKNFQTYTLLVKHEVNKNDSLSTYEPAVPFWWWDEWVQCNVETCGTEIDRKHIDFVGIDLAVARYYMMW